MPFAENYMVQGTFTASTIPGSVNINCGFLPSRVQLYNMSAITSMAGGPPPVNPGSTYLTYEVVWNSAFASAATPFTLVRGITASAATDSITPITSNGISLYDGTKSVQLGSSVTGTTITKANPAVCTATGHGLQTGDTILMTNNAVMTQLGGLAFTVTVTNANTFTIPINTNTANFTQETGFKFRKVIVGSLFYPTRHNISNITAANPIVVSTLSNHGFTVGQQVRLRVPSALGMVQANNLTGVITAVTATTLTIASIDSSAFTAWAWPATTSVPFTPAMVIPIGSGPSPTTLGLVTYNQDVLDDATMNQQFQGFTVGTGILATPSSTVFGVTTNDVIQWTAWRADV